MNTVILDAEDCLVIANLIRSRRARAAKYNLLYADDLRRLEELQTLFRTLSKADPYTSFKIVRLRE